MWFAEFLIALLSSLQQADVAGHTNRRMAHAITTLEYTTSTSVSAVKLTASLPRSVSTIRFKFESGATAAFSLWTANDNRQFTHPMLKIDECLSAVPASGCVLET